MSIIKTVEDFIGKEVFLTDNQDIEIYDIIDAFEVEKIYTRKGERVHKFNVILQLLSKDFFPLRLEIEKQYAFSKNFLEKETVFSNLDETKCILYEGGTTPWFKGREFIQEEVGKCLSEWSINFNVRTKN